MPKGTADGCAIDAIHPACFGHMDRVVQAALANLRRSPPPKSPPQSLGAAGCATDARKSVPVRIAGARRDLLCLVCASF
jgi:hypothetical protein